MRPPRRADGDIRARLRWSAGWPLDGGARSVAGGQPDEGRRRWVACPPRGPAFGPLEWSAPGGDTRAAAAPAERRVPRPDLKPGEPHDRLQGATDLRSIARSKPSEPGGTARAERAPDVAVRGRRKGPLGVPTGSGRAVVPMEGRTLANPKRGVRAEHLSTAPERFGPDRGGRANGPRNRANRMDPAESPKEGQRSWRSCPERLFPGHGGKGWNPEDPAMRREGRGGERERPTTRTPGRHRCTRAATSRAVAKPPTSSKTGRTSREAA
jgi:hypothetical protein